MHYKIGTVHPVYWALAAEADHVLAHSRGGLGDAGNLATAHVGCNTRKSDSLLEEPPAVAGRSGDDKVWDGLVSHYPAIVAAGNARGSRHHAADYHPKWLGYFRQPPIDRTLNARTGLHPRGSAPSDRRRQHGDGAAAASVGEAEFVTFTKGQNDGFFLVAGPKRRRLLHQHPPNIRQAFSACRWVPPIHT